MRPRCQLLPNRLPVREPLVRSAPSIQRTYATSSEGPVMVRNPLRRRKGGDLGSHLPKDIIPKNAYIPAYPYGDHQLFKQANKGLYGHQKIQFGNNVSDKTETTTRRHWKPNVLSKSLYSVVLKKKIKMRITSKVLKMIDREGGLDEYLLKDSESRIKELGPMGWALRWTLMQRSEVVERMRAQAAALGVSQTIIDEQWPTIKMTTEQKAALSTQPAEEQALGLEEGGFAENEEQQMWEPDEAEDEGSQSIPKISKTDKRLAMLTAAEYTKASKAAQRYLKRGIVDTEAQGFKLAFIRTKERKEAADTLKENHAKKLKEMFTPQDLQQIRTQFDLPNIKDRTARRIAFNQQRRQQINEAGSVEAWQALRAQNAQPTASEKTPDTLAQLKARYADLIKEAENVSKNTSLDPEKRAFLESAMQKAKYAIRASASGGEREYVVRVLGSDAQMKLADVHA